MTIVAAKPPDQSSAKSRKRNDNQIAPPAVVATQDVAPAHTYNAKVKQSELIPFTTQLAIMLDSGVVLSDALDAIAEQAEPGTFRDVVIDISETVKAGENFSTALAEYPRIFSPMFISMVRASEASGRMVEMLGVLSGYLNFEADTRKKIRGALTYPIIMATMAIIATATLMFFVLPRFIKIYESKGATLPALTRGLVAVSRTLSDPGSLTTIVTICIVLGVGLWYFAQSLAGRRVIDYLKIHTPVLGTMFIDTIITRSMRIMTTMINTGVSLLDSLEVIRGSCQNVYFQQLWDGVDKRIRDGYQLSDAVKIAPHSHLIAPGIVQMLRAGEKSGKLGDVCDKVSFFYEKKLHASIKTVMTLIEPLMITILGAVIGTIAIALLLPVFRISSVIAH